MPDPILFEQRVQDMAVRGEITVACPMCGHSDWAHNLANPGVVCVRCGAEVVVRRQLSNPHLNGGRKVNDG